MAGPMLKDEKERKAALGTGGSFHIEAPAGSGKTLLLTRRFVALLGEVSHPREILALTFTDKAAGEMRNRILVYLRRAQAHEQPADDSDAEILASAEKALARQHRYADTLMTSDGLNIMTFHGFCNYLIMRAPVEAGVAPDVKVIDETEQPLLIDEAFRLTMEKLFAQPRTDDRRRAFERRLLHHNNNWRSISDEMRTIVKERQRIMDLVEIMREAGGIGTPNLGAVLAERLRRYINYRLSAVKASFSAGALGSSWQPFIRHLASMQATAAETLPNKIPEALWEALPAWQAMAAFLLTKDGQPRKKPGPKAGFYPGFGASEWAAMLQEMDEAAALLHRVRELPLETDPVTDEELLSDFIICAAEVMDTYEDLCKKRSVIDFAGLEETALHVLNEAAPSDLYLSLDHRIRHLLIDEFQDTDRRQWKLVKKLCAGWEPGDGRTISIVGDPKQSIYAFRKAEVRLFTEARNGIPNDSGGAPLALAPLTLTANFRSPEALIGWVNAIFGGRVMASPDDDADEVAFGASTACGREDACAPALCLDIFADEDKENAKESEARWLAHRVRRLLDKKKEGRSVAVLLFTRNRLPLYLTALREAQVPVQVEEGLLLEDRPEVMHLVQMARMLAYPHDDIAWASLLRSPWCWFDAKTLLRVASVPAESWSRKLHRAAEAIGELGEIIGAVDAALRRVGRDRFGRVVKKLWDHCRGPAMTARRYGMSGVANCMRFFEILEQCERETPQETLTTLSWIMHTAYMPVDPTTSRSPVHMMTVHRAKGLEFDYVFLPFMDWKPLTSGPPMPPPYLIERLPATDGSYFVAMGGDRRTGENPKTYAILKKLEKDRRWGEAKRLFYVAATRARTGLMMSAALAAKDGEAAIPHKSILRWVTDEYGCGDIISGAVERTGDIMTINLNPPLPPADLRAASQPRIPPSGEIEPEKIPGEIAPPSAGAGAPDEATAAPEMAGTFTMEQIRGTILHRLIASMIGGGIEPSPDAVAVAFIREGTAEETAHEMAADCLDEAQTTIGSAFISDLIARAKEPVRCEWAMEDRPREGAVRSGSADLAVNDGSFWWIVDFKTGRPLKSESDEAFISRHGDLHRRQMKAYGEMAAAVTGADRAAIRCGIYLTALQKWLEIV